MIRFVNLVVVTLALAGFTATGQVTTKKTPIRSTSAASGHDMYVSYCAACHGANGKGDGPAVPALKAQPTDLTTLAAKNNGQFPTMEVQNVIRQGSVPAHGSSDMPVWGALFHDLCVASGNPDSIVEMRIHNLTDYIKSLQK